MVPRVSGSRRSGGSGPVSQVISSPAVLFLRNLRSTVTESGTAPWDFVPGVVPDVIRKDKSARDLWINSPRTQHHCYSPFDGFNASQRVTKQNPPNLMRALVLDYDCPVTSQQAAEGWARVKRPPTHWEVTLSGNGRGVWMFEQPVPVPGYEFASKFAAYLADKLNARLVAPGVDEGALTTPNRYYTNSGDWVAAPGEPLEHDLLLGWLVEFSATFAFNSRDFGVEFPLDKAAELLAAKYPRFTEWPSDFALNSQGPSFWVPGSTSPKSAIVRATGIQTFAAHADRAFYQWEDLLGKEAVENHRSGQMGHAVGDVFFDGKNYFRPVADGRLKPFTKEDTCQFLRTSRGLSNKADKSGVSQIDKAIAYIHDHHYVVGAAPFCFRPTGMIRVNGEPALNISTKQALTPASEPTVWGESGNFPFLSKFLDALFDPADQKDIFLAWLHVFYKSCHEKKPQSGHNIFIAGGASVGKTLLNRRIIGGLVCGYGEAIDYLLGEDDFGSELFDNGLWAVDDSTGTVSFASHRKFSEIVKRMAANTTFRYHPKFRVPMLVDWQGRVVVTLNRDEESIRLLPDMSLSILDKIMLFRARENYDGVDFRFPMGGVNHILDRELPHFARWLLDYTIPENLINHRDPRFVITPYHNEDLVNTALQSSAVAAFAEILHDWRDTYFATTKAEYWEGTAFQLHKLLHSDPTSTAAMRNYTLDKIGRTLSALKNRGDLSLSCRDEKALRLWRICRPTVKEPEAAKPAEQNQSGSRYAA